MKNKKEIEQIDPFAQIPRIETDQFIWNKAENRLDYVDTRNDIKYVNDNKNLTFKELIEKYGLVNVLKNQDRGIALDETLLYKDINTMWNAGQEYQRELAKNKQSKSSDTTPIVDEQLNNIETNKTEVNNDGQQTN